MRSARRGKTHPSTRTVFESLEPRAMLAGLGPDSYSVLGSTTAVPLPGVSALAGINLSGDSPTPGSSVTSASQSGSNSSGSQSAGLALASGSGAGSATAGSSGSSISGGLALASGSGSGAGSSTTGSSSSSNSGGLALSSSTGPGAGSSTSGTSGGSTSGGLALASGSGSGAGSSGSGTGGNSDPKSSVLSTQNTGGSTAGGQGTGTNSSGTLIGSDLWFVYGAGLGAGSSSSGASGGSLSNLLALLSQYTGGSKADGQSSDAGDTQIDADLWTFYGAGAGAGSSSGSTDGSLANDPTISVLYTGGSSSGQGATVAIFGAGGMVFFVTGDAGSDATQPGSLQGHDGTTTPPSSGGPTIGVITPLVYQFGSDDGPGFHSGVWTGDDGGVHFLRTGESNSNESGRRTLSYEEVYEDWPIDRQTYELGLEIGLWDVPTDPSRPKDEFASIPSDENGNYSWKTQQDFKDFIGRTVQTGKDLAWFMADWLAPDVITNAAKPVIAGGKGLAVFAFGAGRADDGADAFNAARRALLEGKTIPELKEFY